MKPKTPIPIQESIFAFNEGNTLVGQFDVDGVNALADCSSATRSGENDYFGG